MNKSGIIEKVAGLSGVNEADCRKVLDALEAVFQNELSQSGGCRYMMNKIYCLLAYFRKPGRSFLGRL